MVSKELGDNDIIEIWHVGFKKNTALIKGFAQYRQPSGMIRCE
jgi:hypothetical protein